MKKTRARLLGYPANGTRAALAIAAVTVALCLGVGLSACGKRGDPEPPPGVKKSEYPRPYPDPKSY